MTTFFGVALVGAATFLLSIPSYLRAKADDRSPFWRPRDRGAQLRLARRARLALSPRNWLYAWILFVPASLMALVIAGLAIGAKDQSLGWRLGVMGAYLGGVAFSFGWAYFLGLARAIAAGRLGVATLAGKAMARRGNLGQAEAMLLQAAKSPLAHLRQAAAHSLRYIASDASIATLEHLTQDPSSDVKKVATSSLHNIRAVVSGESLESVKLLTPLCDHFRNMDQQLDFATESSEQARLRLEYHQLQEQIERIVYSQLHLRQGFPHIYCIECRSRAEPVHFKEWSWVRCKRCLDVPGLRTGVYKAVGVIGRDLDMEMRGNELLIGLWNTRERAARGAELDALELVGVDAVNYDWAVSAVVEELHRFYKDGMGKLEIRLLQQPPLNANTLRLLAPIAHNLPPLG